MEAKVKRAYDNSRRHAAAASARTRIIDAAAALFVERGYGATTIEDIAAAAGVSRATVFASAGAKPALLKAAFDATLAGDHLPVPMSERPEAKAMEAEPDPGRMLDYYAEVATGRARRIAPLQAVIRHAAGADADVAALWNETEAQRRRGAGIVVARLRRKAGPHSELPDERAADVVWILNDAALYRSLVTDRGWPEPEYTAWLAHSLRAQLLR
jgi:AcrR family transcriptional regulator